MPLICLILAAPALQEPPKHDLEAEKAFVGRLISKVQGVGFKRRPFQDFKNLLETREWTLLRQESLAADVRRLWNRTPRIFSDVGRRVEPDPARPEDHVVVTFFVVEYPSILGVEIHGIASEDAEKVRTEILQLKVGEPLNPYRLQVDRQAIRNFYRKKGYHFCEVQSRVRESGEDVVLTWTVTEGPLVTVDEIVFTAPAELSKGDMLEWAGLEENGLFSSAPFDEMLLQEGVERLRRALRLQGYLDVFSRPSVVVRALEFSEDKTRVRIRIEVDPGPRYKVRRVLFEGHTLFTSEELRREVPLRPGDPLSEMEIWQPVTGAVARLRELYGSRGYIDVRIEADPIAAEEGAEGDVLFSIREGEQARVGRVLVTGNSRTREDRIRLHLREDVIPGEYINLRGIQRAQQRLFESQWFAKSMDAVQVRYEDTAEPHVKDVVFQVREGETVKFDLAVGYNSAANIVGVLQYTQFNFDISDWPTSISEVFSAFRGAGQTLQVTLQPGQTAQTYRLAFTEPYFLNTDLSFLTAFSYTQRQREEWQEGELEAMVRFRRRFGFLAVGIGGRYVRERIFNVEPGAPADVLEFEGTNELVLLQPFLEFDTRDSFVVPTEGMRYELSYEVAWKGFGSDFNFTRLLTEYQFHVPIYTTQSKVRHAIGFRAEFGWVQPFGGDEAVPINQRLFAGGRGTIRGFQFRGVGPMENGSPVGGEVRITGTVEYTMPVVPRVLWLAAWYDIGTLVPEMDDLGNALFRQAYGFGFRISVPQLGQIPVALDFGYVLSDAKEDEKQFILFDIGRFFQ